MKVYFVILLLFSIKFDFVSSKYAIGNIDEDFQERIAEAIHDQNDTDDSIAKLQRIKQILQDVLSLEVSKKSQMEVDVSADGSVTTPSESYQQPKTCSSYLGCEECVSHSCGWCIANRSCKEDAAWQCLGEHDHVGLSGIGRYKTCPSTKEMDEMRATRRKRKLEAKSSPQKEDDISSSDSSSTASEDSAAPLSKDEKTKELLRRAELAKENYGLAHPYETLGVPVTASGGEIRKAYRKLSLLYHPDKNPGDENADSAFKDIVNAFEILGDPEKREYYDDMGSSNMEAFNTMEDYLRFGKKNEGNFYQGSKLITPLTESVWERRVGSGNTIWLVEFYAPWCGHCQTKIPIFKKIAEMLEDDENIEVGAVNCATQNVICHQWFGIPEFPSLLALNDYHGMRQEYRGDFQPEPVIAWLKTVEKEWKWLMHSSNLIEINSIKHFNKQVMSSDEFWIVVYMDGFDCISCQTAKTNAMRLSASLRGYTGIKIGIVSCEDKSANALCYKDQGLPSRPHAPVVKGYSTGPKGTNRQGEVLYNTNEVEQHIALELLERTVRLSLADKIVETDALDSENEASTSGYEKDKPKKEDKKPPERPQQPLWNGPKRRDPVGWGGGGFHEVPRGFRLQ